MTSVLELSDGERVIGAIEAGGSTFVCGVGRTWREVRDGERFVVPTSNPASTLAAVAEWFAERPLDALGVAAFGPLNLANGSLSATTPKVAWRRFSWRQAVAHYWPGLPVALDTDVNAAALAEARWGQGRGRRVLAYLTVGTGIGGGLVVDGRALHGLSHPEMGHMIVRRRPEDPLEGVCERHGDCLEGLASGAALRARSGDGRDLALDDDAWNFEIDYLAQAMVNVTLLTSPEVIVLGGGVSSVMGLRDAVGARTKELLNDYVDLSTFGPRLGDYIVAPALGDAAGVVGAFTLAEALA